MPTGSFPIPESSVALSGIPDKTVVFRQEPVNSLFQMCGTNRKIRPTCVRKLPETIEEELNRIQNFQIPMNQPLHCIASVAIGLFCLLHSNHIYAATLPASLSEAQVAYYPFDGNGANQVSASFGSTPTGNFRYESNGSRGQSLRIQGDNAIFYAGGGHVILPTFSTVITNDFTVVLWAQKESLGGVPFNEEAYFTFGALNGNLTAILLNSFLNKIRFLAAGYSPSYAEAEISIPVDISAFSKAWKQIVLSYGSDALTAYINGKQVGTTSLSVGVLPVSVAGLGRHWWDGGASSSARLNANIDDVRIFNRSLTAEEIEFLYYNDKPTAPHLSVRVKNVDVISEVEIGKIYQLESTTGFGSWEKFGTPFVATMSSHTNQAEVTDGNRYFRIIEIPVP